MNYRMDETFVANADLSAKQFYLVVNSTGNRVGVSGAGAAAAGVLQDKPQSGEFGTVTILGRSRVRAGDTITAGGLFASDATGTAVAVTSGAYAAGLALTGVASGGIFDGLINHAGYKG